MVYAIHWNPYGRPVLSQYEADPQELARREAEADQEERRDNIRAAWDAWADFNSALHTLGPPPEIIEAWDRLRPWIEQQAEMEV